MTRAAAALLAFLLGAAPAAGRAQALVADLSDHLIAITTSFTGTSVVLFGAVDGPGDIAVVVQGPAETVTVRRKERVLGIWMNGASSTFTDVPSFYAVALSRPLGDDVPKTVLARHEIGVENIRLVPARQRTDIDWFQQALVRGKQESGLYPLEPAEISFLGERLFRTKIHFPSNVPTGAYQIGVYLIQDGDVVSAQTTPLIVSKLGFGAAVSRFAHTREALYGLSAVLGAAAMGWIGGLVFRKG